jgi:hypothetical protein
MGKQGFFIGLILGFGAYLGLGFWLASKVCIGGCTPTSIGTLILKLLDFSSRSATNHSLLVAWGIVLVPAMIGGLFSKK